MFEFTFQLKQVALRLKRNVTEKTEEIERLKSENAKISSKSQNLSTIQQEFDKALDEVERLKRLESSLQKDLRSAVDENLILKEKSFENQALIQVQNSESFLILQDIYWFAIQLKLPISALHPKARNPLIILVLLTFVEPHCLP